jgi:gamma-glutamylcysteine synthetase
MPTTAVGWIGLFVLVISFLGTAVVFLRGSRDKGTISTLEQNNKALTERVTLLEASETRLKADAAIVATRHAAELDALNIRVKALENDNAELRSQRPSAEAIEAVYHAVQAVHSDTRRLVAALEAK